MTPVERLLHEAHLRYQRQTLRPTAQTEDTVVSILPASEVRGVRYAEPQSQTWLSQHRVFRPVGFYRIHCPHDKLKWDTCTQCKRDKREAQQNFAKMARGEKF